MKTLNLALDYGRTAEAVAKVSDASLTINYIENAVSTKYPTLQGQKLRMWGRIQRKLDAAEETKVNALELEEADVDFLKEAFKEPVFQTALAKYVVILMDAFDKL